MIIRELQDLLDEYFDNTPLVIRIVGVDDAGHPTAVEARTIRVREVSIEDDVVVVVEVS